MTKKQLVKKRNVTVQMDELLLKHSRHLAVEEDMSLSEWIATLIGEAVKRKSAQAGNRDRALAVLKSPLRLGGNVFSRQELHDR